MYRGTDHGAGSDHTEMPVVGETGYGFDCGL
jgi:hypothetical protein